MVLVIVLGFGSALWRFFRDWSKDMVFREGLWCTFGGMEMNRPTFGQCKEMQEHWQDCFYKVYNRNQNATEAVKQADIAFKAMFGVDHTTWIRWFLGSSWTSNQGSFDDASDFSPRIPPCPSRSETSRDEPEVPQESQK